MHDGKCSKKYPKRFNECTSLDNYGYPTYRRRDDGRTITIGGVALDNRWVVPYNPYLSRKYNAHINVEICSQIRVTKYLYKYIHKGSDRATIIIEESGQSIDASGTKRYKEIDEVKQYFDCRYLSAP